MEDGAYEICEFNHDFEKSDLGSIQNRHNLFRLGSKLWQYRINPFGIVRSLAKYHFSLMFF